MFLISLSFWFLFQEPEIPAFLSVVFSEEIIANVMAIIAITKVFRNFLGDIKGKWALYLTGFVGLAIGIIQYWEAYGILSILIGLLAGGISAGVFKGTKFFGKKVLKVEKK